ncbi:hypothetical protein [Actinobaculum suis]|uniref:hypothetical protein n=1 Tax=Actinobaculum suis TaxID=1657 RepID=UPI001C8DDCF5|nr:hypothetical protein [Actinobaculum suis]
MAAVPGVLSICRHRFPEVYDGVGVLRRYRAASLPSDVVTGRHRYRAASLPGGVVGVRGSAGHSV